MVPVPTSTVARPVPSPASQSVSAARSLSGAVPEREGDRCRSDRARSVPFCRVTETASRSPGRTTPPPTGDRVNAVVPTGTVRCRGSGWGSPRWRRPPRQRASSGRREHEGPEESRRRACEECAGGRALAGGSRSCCGSLLCDVRTARSSEILRFETLSFPNARGARPRPRLNGRVIPDADPALCRALAADLRAARLPARGAAQRLGRGRRRRDRARPARAGRPRPRRAAPTPSPCSHACSCSGCRSPPRPCSRRCRAPASTGLESTRARGIRRWRRRAPAGAGPPAVVRGRRAARASGGSRATSTRRRSADRSPKTTCSASAARRSRSRRCSCRPRPRRGLDIGTGCGIQALRARRAIDHVVATDISERALGFTRLNALLNDVDGDRDPRRAASSSPSPASGSTGSCRTRRSSSRRAWRACRVRVPRRRPGRRRPRRRVRPRRRRPPRARRRRAAARQLGDAAAGAPGLDRVREWVAAVAGAARRLGRRAREPRSRCRTPSCGCATAARCRERPGFARLVDAWLDDFAARNVVGDRLRIRAAAASGGGDRRPSRGTSRCRRRSPGDGLGAHLADALAAHDRLATLDDAGLAASVLVVAPDVTEARHHLPGSEDPTVIELRQGGGFGRVARRRPRARGPRRRVRRRPRRRAC